MLGTIIQTLVCFVREYVDICKVSLYTTYQLVSIKFKMMSENLYRFNCTMLQQCKDPTFLQDTCIIWDKNGLGIWCSL